MVQNLKEYFQKKLDEIFADKIEMSLWQDSIWTDIDSYDEDLIFSFDYKKIQEIFPNFGIEHVEFDYIGDDHDGLSSCDTA
ncbi:hypothetical protein RZR97_01505 [Hydrogenimonas thermophila]|nr:hypothetical protein [Hydrogenimonas thermophila]WOE70261.1 hypothetical protein RZR91_01515 [Hydrogenimonas thermophila]WOE72778.1 hypothetical protein RZR97_01505 [Hydrogenimonas thermophila]